MARRLHLDLFNGMRALAFLSFVMGISTLIVCGWTFLSNRLNIDSKYLFDSVVVTAKPKPASPASTETMAPLTSDSADAEVLDMLRDTVMRCSIIVVLLVVVQIVSAAFILGSAAQSCRARIKMWFVLNSGINVAILICLTMPLMYQIQHGRHLQTIDTTSETTLLEVGPGSMDIEDSDRVSTLSTPQQNASLNSNESVPQPQIRHLNSFYIGLASNFVAQFVALISCLLLLRFNKHGRVEYEHVENMST